MRGIIRALRRFEAMAIGTVAGLAVLLVVYEVFARYLMPSMLTDWGGEVIIYLMISAVLIGGGSLVTEGRHIRADLFIRMAPQWARRVADIASLVAGLAYCAIITWYGVAMVNFARMIDIRSDSSLYFPQWIFYIVVPVAFASMATRYALLLWRAVFMGHDVYGTGVD
ncbi:TRAP transporter small permease [Hoeflea sp.]|uniref:TRAP transporter small permease n=1 Tax=Hoeflea sp. TaxID=1940281 RepID=UPI0019AF912D|nr:TRAP transporter small permease [Hoeflea sp.]MBC7284907.1 TRAP transporter small permease [Hoeflea sp.]